MEFPAGLTLDILRNRFTYDAMTGVITRHLFTFAADGRTRYAKKSACLGKHNYKNGKAMSVYILTRGRRINARKLVVALQTGYWPEQWDYSFRGSDILDLRWCNFSLKKNFKQEVSEKTKEQASDERPLRLLKSRNIPKKQKPQQKMPDPRALALEQRVMILEKRLMALEHAPSKQKPEQESLGSTKVCESEK